MTETHERHIVFTNDLSEGVSAVAKAIARRQARDAAFPNAACANEILYVCQEAERRIPDVDMAPISSLMLNVPLGSIRDDHPSDHDRLATLCELSLGAHLVRPYSRQEEVAVARLFAALHLAFSDEPLPIANYAAHGIAGGDVVDSALHGFRAVKQSCQATTPGNVDNQPQKG